MDKEEIIALARQAGFKGCSELTWENVICTEELEAFAKLVADKEREGLVRIIEANIADEREACAALIESYGTWENTEVLCQAIRNRGEA